MTQPGLSPVTRFDVTDPWWRSHFLAYNSFSPGSPTEVTGLLCSQANSWIITSNLLLHRALLCLTLMENYSCSSSLRSSGTCADVFGSVTVWRRRMKHSSWETQVQTGWDFLLCISFSWLNTLWPLHKKIKFLTSPWLCVWDFVSLSSGICAHLCTEQTILPNTKVQVDCGKH